MSDNLTRRVFLGTAGAAIAAGSGARAVEAAESDSKPAGRLKILAVACSPRKGKNTAASLAVCLEGAAEAGERIDVELIDLAGLAIDGSPAAGVPLPKGQPDDFPALVPKLTDPGVGGIIIGSPVYFSGMSALCKAFLDRWMAFYRKGALADKVAGVLAVGGSRNGGQEVVIRSVQDAMFCHDMIVVGPGKPASRFGASVWSKDGAAADKDGLAAAKNLGRRVATIALALAGG